MPAIQMATGISRFPVRACPALFVPIIPPAVDAAVVDLVAFVAISRFSESCADSRSLLVSPLAAILGDRSCGAMRGKEFCPKEKEIQRAERGLRLSRLRRPIASNRDQNLLSHFGEAGTAVLAVKQVEYGGHAQTLAEHHR